jgi:hypothetical protein
MQGGCIAINILEHARELEREVEEFARQLEIELAASLENQCIAQAEVERLDHLLADASETNHKLAAEVDRLTGLLTK